MTIALAFQRLLKLQLHFAHGDRGSRGRRLEVRLVVLVDLLNVTVNLSETIQSVRVQPSPHHHVRHAAFLNK